MSPLSEELSRVRPDELPPPQAPVRPSPLAAVRRRPGLAVTLSLTGLLLGLLLGAARPVHHTAEARLVIGQLDVGSNAIPGFALATQQLAVTYSRLLASDQVRRDVAAELGDDTGLEGFTASPLPESAIIRVEAVARSRQLAVRAADAAAAALVGQVQRLLLSNPGEALLEQYLEARRRVAAARASLAARERELGLAPPEQQATARAAVQEAQARVDTTQLESDTLGQRYQRTVGDAPGAPLRSVSAAAVTESSRSGTLQLYGLAGLALGVLLALLATSAAAARAARQEVAVQP